MPSAGVVIVLVAIVVVAGITQGTIGFGFTFVAAPIANWLVPGAVPSTILLLGVPMTTVMAWRERHHIDASEFGWISLGRVPGTLAGLLVVRAVGSDMLTVVVGVAIMVGVILSVAGWRFGASRRASVSAGMVSGVMGTTAAIGGAPLALKFQDRPGPEYRSTLAVSFAFGASLSVAALALGDQIAGWHVALAAALLPAMLCGILLSGATARRINAAQLRRSVLVFAFVSGGFSVLRPWF